jgi:hypothetical protein
LFLLLIYFFKFKDSGARIAFSFCYGAAGERVRHLAEQPVGRGQWVRGRSDLKALNMESIVRTQSLSKKIIYL